MSALANLPYAMVCALWLQLYALFCPSALCAVLPIRAMRCSAHPRCALFCPSALCVVQRASSTLITHASVRFARRSSPGVFSKDWWALEHPELYEAE